MLLRDHYYSAKWRIVEIKKFSIGAGTTAVLVSTHLSFVRYEQMDRQVLDKIKCT